MASTMSLASLVLIVAYWCSTADGAALLGLPSCPPNDAFVHNDHYYQFFDCPTTWDEAEKNCMDKMRADGKNVTGGHLVSIMDKNETDWLEFQISMRYGAKVGIWIGIQKRNPPGKGADDCFPRYFKCNQCDQKPVGNGDGMNPPCSQCKWTDGTPIRYTNFQTMQPNCRWQGEDCFHLIDNREWNDGECGSSMRYICKAKVSNSRQ